MAAEVKKEIQLEIAHVLFIDIAGYSKLSINEQRAVVDELTKIVRGSDQYQKAEAAGRLIKIPTGDGMALVFYTNQEAPAQCAIEISGALKAHPRLQVRMGVHSGPVSGMIDVNGHANLAGAGLNMAQRVMACGDAGHILVSKHVAEDLEEYEHWRPLLHDLGTCEVKENAYFANGIQDELLSNLAKIKDLKVISRTSVMQYKGGITRNLKEIAQQLGVSNVVEGSVRRSGNRIRVSVQLIDAQTDRHIWVQNYDRTLADSITLQDELATEIAGALGATLSPQEKARVEAKPTNNPAAYDAYLRGRAFAAGSQFDKSAVEGAIQSFQEAVKLDPSFAL